MVAPEFYPCQVISAHRTGKFCKYLPEFGWDISVLTVDAAKAGWPVDRQLVAEVEHVERITAFYPFTSGLKAVVRVLARKLRGGSRRGTGGNSEAKDPVPPDKGVFWMPWAVRAGLSAARRSDVIYATSPPPSTLLIGAALKLLTGKPLVVDLRDPWTISHLLGSHGTVRRRIESRLEHGVFRIADTIICNTERVQRRYQREYPLIPAERFRVIPNGYDAADFRDLRPAGRSSDALRIGYFGKVYAGRSPRTLFAAAAQAFETGLIPRADLEFMFFGPSGSIIESEARELGVSDRVCARPTLPYKEALREMAACDVLLILGSPETDEYHVPGKTFEYLALAKPVLVHAGEGALADLMKEYGFGLRVAPGDIEGAARALSRLLQDIRAGAGGRYVGRAQGALTRRELTRSLSGILDRLAEDPGRRRGAGE